MIFLGQQTYFNFNIYTELIFTDQAAFQIFLVKMMAPEAAAQIAVDKKGFLD